MNNPDYVAEAARFLRKMQAANEAELARAQYPGDRRPLIEQGLRISAAFAELARERPAFRPPARVRLYLRAGRPRREAARPRGRVGRGSAPP